MNSLPFSINMDYHMQFTEFLSLLPKCLLSYAVFGISLSSPKTWTIICNFWNFFLFSKNMEYHMQFQEFLSLFPNTWTIICNFWNFFPFSRNVDIHMQSS